MLTDVERRVLFVYCFDHTVASCADCRRDYKFDQLGIDIIGHRSYFCPVCRRGLVDEVRLHIVGCPGIAAALHEHVERSRELKKESDRLVLSSAILAAESEALAKRVLEGIQRFRQSPPSPAAS